MTTEDTPQAWRARIRSGEYHGPTSGLAKGYAQANLLVLPEDVAQHFEEFCGKNERSCPLLERLRPGLYNTRLMADDADIRTDLPRYHVYQGDHLVADTTRLTGEAHEWWSPDMVAFLLGCSFTFEWALLEAGIPLYHQQQGKNVAMYRTTIPLKPVHPFKGNMVVSMRYVPVAMMQKAMQVSSRFPRMHGRPIHTGDPRAIGIKDLERPDFGEAIEKPPGTMAMFWACGVTAQEVALKATHGKVICHAPGHMLILDKRNEEFDEARVKA